MDGAGVVAESFWARHRKLDGQIGISDLPVSFCAQAPRRIRIQAGSDEQEE
jgi:hypothetical protein